MGGPIRMNSPNLQTDHLNMEDSIILFHLILLLEKSLNFSKYGYYIKILISK